MDNGSFSYVLEQALDENERIFKFTGAVLNAREEVIITLLVAADDYDAKLDDALRAKVEKIIREVVPEAYETHVIFRKTDTDERFIREKIFGYFYDSSPIMTAKIKDAPVSVETGYGSVKISVGLPPDVFSYAKSGELDKNLADYLETQIIEHIEVEFYRTESDSAVSRKKIRKIESVRQSIRLADVNVVVPLVGAIAKKPAYITDVGSKESDSATVCGKVVAVEERKTQAGKEYFRFTLDDTTGKLECLFFSRFPSQIERLRTYLLQDVCAVAEGNLKMDERSAKYVMFVRKISTCTIDYASIRTDVVYKEVSDEYYTVEPADYAESEQGTMFEEEGELPELLKGRIVVFDLETTGLSPTGCEIIEIGAVLMEDGVLRSVFSTLINPGVHIPEETSAVNHIYDEDVASAPSFEDVVGDFYKFAYGATLAAHNAPFDMSFLTYHAAKYLYNFDNPVIDTLPLARKVIKRDRGVNLGALCERFGIELTNAHRAVYDAIATAKVLKVLAKLDKQ